MPSFPSHWFWVLKSVQVQLIFLLLFCLQVFNLRYIWPTKTRSYLQLTILSSDLSPNTNTDPFSAKWKRKWYEQDLLGSAVKNPENMIITKARRIPSTHAECSNPAATFITCAPSRWNKIILGKLYKKIIQEMNQKPRSSASVHTLVPSSFLISLGVYSLHPKTKSF